MVLGAGNRLALAAGLGDEWNLLMCTRFLNLDTIVSKLLNLDTIVSKCRIGVIWISVGSFLGFRWSFEAIDIPEQNNLRN